MSVINTWVGAVTPATAWVRSKVAASSVRLAVADNPGLAGPEFYGPVSPTPQQVASIEATGLAPNTQYWFALETDGSIDTSVTGRFHTHPAVGEPASYMFAAASCAGNLDASRVSNHEVFDTIRQLDPLFFAHLGDLHYPIQDHARQRTEGLDGGRAGHIRGGVHDLAQPVAVDGHLERLVVQVHSRT
ncbi:hypothetical protein [Phytoactinopolyspora mesophila]|uniref:hypothetical protein n=1 Tax=Phytoactinopolyspora mesophila TaxID=2650750 RepID=UPI001FE2AE5F|nr:hypothetical protein [Phytoactinopolyspora mesophila]